jgi:hypothetical protein
MIETHCVIGTHHEYLKQLHEFKALQTTAAKTPTKPAAQIQHFS